MRIIKLLSKYKSFLTNARECSFIESFYHPYIKGQYEGREAEIGVDIKSTDGYTYDIYCKLKLRTHPNLPFFLKNYLPLEEPLVIKGGWLVYYHYDTYASGKELRRYLEEKMGRDIHGIFTKLVDISRRIDNGAIPFEQYILDRVRTLRKDILIAVIITISVAGIVYVYVYSPFKLPVNNPYFK